MGEWLGWGGGVVGEGGVVGGGGRGWGMSGVSNTSHTASSEVGLQR